MAHLYIIPQWFFGFDIAMEFLFGIITLAVALSAWKIYKISEEKSLKSFGAGFFLISLSYIFWAMSNWIAFSGIKSATLSFDNITFALAIGIYAHMFFLASGLITLAYTTFKVDSGRVYYLLLALTLLILASSFNKLGTFRILSVFLLAFIAYYYFKEWRSSNSKSMMRLFFAFALLILSNFDFAFSSDYCLAYVFGHLLELGAYILILQNLIPPLIKIFRKGRKT